MTQISLNNSITVVQEGAFVFNNIAGNLDRECTKELLLNQIKLIEEEVQEIREAIEQKEDVELLDGILDTQTVLYGLMQIVHKAKPSMKFLEASEALVYNNLSKFPDANDPEIIQIIRDTTEKYRKQYIEIDLHVNQQYNKVVFKNKETGKVLKPSNYSKLDLKQYV